MTEYEKMEELYRDLRKLCVKHQVSFVTATQIKRTGCGPLLNEDGSKAIFTDYLPSLV